MARYGQRPENALKRANGMYITVLYNEPRCRYNIFFVYV